MAEIVDERNEADARQLLLRVCEQVEQRSRISLDRIQNQVNPMLAGLASAPEGEKRGKYEGEGFHARQEKNLKENEEVQSWSMEMQIAVGFVKQLVEEEEEIAQRVAYSVEQGVEF